MALVPYTTGSLGIGQDRRMIWDAILSRDGDVHS